MFENSQQHAEMEREVQHEVVWNDKKQIWSGIWWRCHREEPCLYQKVLKKDEIFIIIIYIAMVFS